MREIKFRAWDTVLRKFFDGDILNDYNLGDFLNDDRYIVTQYTGLKDVNGRKIYEGDVVEFEHDTRYNGGGYNRSLYKAAVQNGLEFEFLKTGYYIRFSDFKSNLITEELDWSKVKRVQVIGNIYKNHESLSK